MLGEAGENEPVSVLIEGRIMRPRDRNVRVRYVIVLAHPVEKSRNRKQLREIRLFRIPKFLLILFMTRVLAMEKLA